MEKQPYVAPRIVELGKVEELTLGTSVGQKLDRTFPADTPRGELTFS